MISISPQHQLFKVGYSLNSAVLRYAFSNLSDLIARDLSRQKHTTVENLVEGNDDRWKLTFKLTPDAQSVPTPVTKGRGRERIISFAQAGALQIDVASTGLDDIDEQFYSERISRYLPEILEKYQKDLINVDIHTTTSG